MPSSCQEELENAVEHSPSPGSKRLIHRLRLFWMSFYFPAPSRAAELLFLEEQERPNHRPVFCSMMTNLPLLGLQKSSDLRDRPVQPLSTKWLSGRCPSYQTSNPSSSGALLQPQMTLDPGMFRLCSEVPALVLWVGPLVALLKELVKATGRSRNSWRCHWRHFF